MRGVIITVVLMGAAIGLIAPSPDDRTPEPPSATELPKQVRPAAATPASVASGPGTVIERDPSGHYFAEVRVNGMPAQFMVDTGASVVALSVDDAERLGITYNPMDFSVIGSGASGPVRGVPVMLNEVSLNGHTVSGVAGAVVEGLDQSLLGQSFLERTRGVQIRDGQMRIE
jgi:aspartyl protease family protein